MTILSSHVDGYMTTIPNSAQPLVERTKNQEGAIVYCEHGQGRMIVNFTPGDTTLGIWSPNYQRPRHIDRRTGRHERRLSTNCDSLGDTAV